ncbi:MAG: hypothetical protein D8M52_11170 [Chlorobi bacterium]|nr:hypothetical protein [Ignavibacteriota bacterium]MBL1162247.1 hypothetical protein [Chlorobiota bacterium]NOG68710.1 hypothetical protein [Chlorobiota bacterium]
MKSTDKFLIGIIAGAVLLVGIAFAVAFMRPQPSYQPEDTPEGVAHNYLFALQQADYRRAYGYLSPALAGYPASPDKFAADLDKHAWQLDNLNEESITLAVESVRVTDDRAEVSVKETRFYRGGLFDSNEHSTTFEMTLHRENGAWKITASDAYWPYCWDSKVGCS